VIACHHERWDGSGYPRGLRGIEIPLAARIFAVADVFDAMTNDQPYRDALPVEQARDEIRARAGLDFDPDVVEAFFLVDEPAPPAEA
jgi:HD-GYP domain-containing protein (c-di-GMP phosphodiesterase class II)